MRVCARFGLLHDSNINQNITTRNAIIKTHDVGNDRMYAPRVHIARTYAHDKSVTYRKLFRIQCVRCAIQSLCGPL